MLKRMKKAADAKIALANAMEELEIYRISNKSGNSTPFANAALNSDDAPALSSDDADLAQKIKNLTGKQVSEPIPQLPAGTTLTHFKRDPKAAPGKDHEGNLLPPGSLTWDEWIELTNPNRDINDEVNFEYGRWKAHVDEGRESLAKYINNTSKPATNETSTSDFSSEEKPKDPAPMDIDTNKKVYTDEDVKNMISEYARPNGIISKEEVREIKNKTRISKEQMKKITEEMIQERRMNNIRTMLKTRGWPTKEITSEMSEKIMKKTSSSYEEVKKIADEMEEMHRLGNLIQ